MSDRVSNGQTETDSDEIQSVPCLSVETARPGCCGLRQFAEDLGVGSAGTLEDVERMVCGFDNLERRWWTQLGADGPQQSEICKRVAGALQKKHRHGDFCKMVGAFGAGLVGWVQWETKENEAADLIEWLLGGGRGSHASAHGLAAGEER
jgi:hypothetical protein